MASEYAVYRALVDSFQDDILRVNGGIVLRNIGNIIRSEAEFNAIVDPNASVLTGEVDIDAVAGDDVSRGLWKGGAARIARVINQEGYLNTNPIILTFGTSLETGHIVNAYGGVVGSEGVVGRCGGQPIKLLLVDGNHRIYGLRMDRGEGFALCCVADVWLTCGECGR